MAETFLEMPKEFADCWPRSGPTGAAVSGLREFTIDRPVQRVTWLRPSRPSRTVMEYEVEADAPDAWWCDDCDCFHAYRELSDEELERAIADWEKAVAEWDRTGGVHLIPGPETITGVFKCEDGCVCTGIMGAEPGDWHWTEWRTSND